MELFEDDIVAPLTIQIKFEMSTSKFRDVSPY